MKSARSMNSSRLNGTLRVPAVWVFRVVHRVKFFHFSFGIIRDHDFERVEARRAVASAVRLNSSRMVCSSTAISVMLGYFVMPML